MSHEEDQQPKRGFKVEDRRRFSETGDVLPDRAEADTPAAHGDFRPVTERESAPSPTRDEAPPTELNFSTFVISLSTQALAHLGEIPDPFTKQTTMDLGAARQMIDILGILRDKTKGNLDSVESNLLEGLLYDLRLRFVERSKR